MPALSPSTKTDKATAVVAAFDFDGTLTHRDTLLPFLQRSLGWAGLARALLLSSPWLAAFALRLMSNHRAKARLLQFALAGQNRTDMDRHAQRFATDYLPTQWQTWAMQQLREHQRQGHLCVIISASPKLYLQAVAASLGIDALLCTEMELQGDTYTGRMTTANCHGEEKVVRLQAWLSTTLGPNAKLVLHAYGDTSGDKPMLRLADHAWYRNQPWADR